MRVRSSSYYVEVKWYRDDHDVLWTSDGTRFLTKEEAEAYGEYLLLSRTDLYAFRTRWSDLLPNASWGL